MHWKKCFYSKLLAIKSQHKKSYWILLLVVVFFAYLFLFVCLFVCFLLLPFVFKGSFNLLIEKHMVIFYQFFPENCLLMSS